MIQDFANKKLKADSTEGVILRPTSINSNLSISSDGFYTIGSGFDAKEVFAYTRNAFNVDWKVKLKHTSGNYLMSWSLDSNSLPGEPGNLLDSLESVNLGSISGNAAETNTVILIGSTNSSENNSEN